MRETDARVLAALRMGPLTRQQIGRRLRLAKATVNQAVHRLIAAGCLEVAADQWEHCGERAYRVVPSACLADARDER